MTVNMSLTVIIQIEAIMNNRTKENDKEQETTQQ